MKFIKKLMYIILVLLALGYAFVLVCSFNPDITKKSCSTAISGNAGISGSS